MKNIIILPSNSCRLLRNVNYMTLTPRNTII
jgi:hypothetical protein